MDSYAINLGGTAEAYDCSRLLQIRDGAFFVSAEPSQVMMSRKKERFMMNYKVPRGTQDILPEQSWKWQQVEKEIGRASCRERV